MEAPPSLYAPQISRGIMDEEDDDDDEEEELGTPSSTASSLCDSAGSDGSSSSELADGATSKNRGGPYEMSSLMAQLPFKRGLSRHFNGKARSFTSLASVRCLADLAKPERPCCRRRLKPCRSYGAGQDGQKPPQYSPVNGCSKTIAKRTTSRGSTLLPASVLVTKRPPGFLGSGRPPVAPPHRSSGGFSTRPTLLFA